MVTVDADEFRIWWRAEFGGCPPVGHRLREAFPSRWVRFHSLPSGNRYAETHDEAAEIVRRHGAVASALLGDGEPIVVVCTGYSETEQPVPPQNHPALPAWLQLAHADTVVVDEDHPQSYWHFWTARATWRPGRFDELLMGVARDEIANLLLVHPGRRAVYHPYDGGADVIGADIFVCDSLRRDFRHWLSAHPSGL
jgi:hypothetical protein